MTQKKCDIVSNKTLDNLMRTKGVRILPLVRTTRVSLAKAASPPSSPPPSLTTKMRADVAEALVGAYYVDGGEEAALAFLRWLCVPLPNDFEFIMLSPVSRAMAASALSACHSVGSTGQSLNHRIPLNGPLLEEALTHASVTSAKSNQRLEFLGDAVLDFIITTKLWEQCPNLSPGLYTELRSRIVCNRRLAMLAVDLELVDRIRHDSESLRYSINRFVKFMTSEHTTGEGARTVEESYPKVLADVVEAVIGALYLEKCCSLKAVWRILKPHLIGDIEYAKRIDGKCVT
jgi:endoribonuclease Dicer